MQGGEFWKEGLIFQQTVTLIIEQLENTFRPLLDNGLKGGNSESPERASICSHFGVCLSVCLYVCISHKTARVVKSCPPCTLFQLIANRQQHNFTIVS